MKMMCKKGENFPVPYNEKLFNAEIYEMWSPKKAAPAKKAPAKKAPADVSDVDVGDLDID